MTESEWANRMAQQFKVNRARKTQGEAQVKGEQATMKRRASEFWTQVKGAFKAKAERFNAALGEEVLIWDAGDANSFTLRRKDIDGCVKGIYQESGNEFSVDVLGRVVPLHVSYDYRRREYRLLGASDKPTEPGDFAATLIEEFLDKF